jgi:hypothetical protein
MYGYTTTGQNSINSNYLLALIQRTTMKKIITMAIATILLGTAAISTVQVAPAEARMTINQRQSHQRYRIYRGTRNGSLSYRESGRLNRQQYRIDRQESRFRANGRLSIRERRILRMNQNNASRNIYRLRHNRVYN